MRALVQRVASATVTSTPLVAVEGQQPPSGATDEAADGTAPTPSPVETGRIGRGLVALVGVTHDDDEAAAAKLAEKIWHLRVFPDDEGAMNRSCADIGGGVLVVSQFTLYGDTRKGRRPSFVAAARPEQAEPLVDHLVHHLARLGADVATGRFRTHMDVALVNDGPVTLLLET